MTGTYEVLEHTADVGLRLRGSTLEEVFRTAGEGFAELQGAWYPREGEPRSVEVLGSDPGQLLVAWLDELLYLQEAHDVVFGGFDVEAVNDDRVRARVRLAPRDGRSLESVGVKAATLHRLMVERRPEGWLAEIYLDV